MHSICQPITVGLPIMFRLLLSIFHIPQCPKRSLTEEKLYLGINFYRMTRQAIIEKTLKAINQLPEDKAEEILTLPTLLLNGMRNTN